MEKYISESIIAGLFEISVISMLFKAVVLILVMYFFSHIFKELFEGIKDGRKRGKKIKEIAEEQSKELLQALLVIIGVVVTLFNFFIPVLAILEAIVVWFVLLILEAIPEVWDWIKEKMGNG